MVAIYCAVEGCWGSKESKHTFPNPSKNMELFNKWVEFCRNKRLLEMIPDKIFKNSRICRLHFEATDFLANNRLKRSACPKIRASECSIAKARGQFETEGGIGEPAFLEETPQVPETAEIEIPQP
ncbi:hypothetical protein ABEB36_013849 [Hypothenemus hampei]|uniref:THAP-type domain-containing protein n=1 Tax=Hypothenemus hampei TaxID=57062 RepID=A0ABD1E5G0_HYPHA